MPSKQRIDSLRWLSGSLATALAVVAMQITGMTHPPAGATALLAAVNPDIYGLSWYYLPVVLLSSVLILFTALMFNNIQRRYLSSGLLRLPRGPFRNPQSQIRASLTQIFPPQVSTMDTRQALSTGKISHNLQKSHHLPHSLLHDTMKLKSKDLHKKHY